MADFVQNVFDLIAAKNLEKEKSIGLTKKVTLDLSTKSKEIDNHRASDLFMAARDFAGNHIQQFINSNPDYKWYKIEYTHPCFDHFSFKYKNQIFSILVDIRNPDGKSFLPPEFLKRQLNEAEKNNLVPCVFPVVIDNPDDPALNTIKIVGDGINLFHTVKKTPIIPEDIGTDEKILMSHWEKHNYAIMQARLVLKEKGVKVVSFQDIPVVNPQLWMLNDVGEKCWVVVRYYTGTKEATITPEEITEITRRCFKFNGYFCSVGLNPSKNTKEKYLYRNASMDVTFNGFRPIHTYM